MSQTALKPHRGVLILVLGILSILVCPLVLGQVAWVLGNQDLKEMDAGTMDPEGRGLTLGGKILGIVASVILVLSVIGFGLAILVALIAEAS